MSSAKPSIEEHRSRLERRANVIRSRLLRTIDALDTRRHQVAELGQHAKRLAVPVAATVVAVALAAFGTAFVVTRYLKHRRERTLGFRVTQALARVRQEPRPSIFEDVLRKLAITVVSIVASEFTKRSVKNVLDGRVPSGRLLVGKVTDGNRTTALVTR